MEYIVTYQFDKENDLWKTNKFTSKEKAEEYYNRRSSQWDKVYFSNVLNKNNNKQYKYFISIDDEITGFSEYKDAERFYIIEIINENNPFFYIEPNGQIKQTTVDLENKIKNILRQIKEWENRENILNVKMEQYEENTDEYINLLREKPKLIMKTEKLYKQLLEIKKQINLQTKKRDKIYFSTIDNGKKLIGCEKKYKYVLNDSDGQKVKIVIGRLINYDDPFTGRFFIENDNGALEIIPMSSVVEMREIVE